MSVATATAAELGSGKGHRDENFPVASWLVAARHRAPVLAFYRFARAADDVADHPEASAERKLALLAAMRATLAGDSKESTEAADLRAIVAARDLSPVHGFDLLRAFERDVTVGRYESWDDLIDYCRLSAMPVGRFVLDVHGEARTAWSASDALCAALQVINHLQDCARDYSALDRVYLPLNCLAAHGARVEDLGAAAASPALRAVVVDLAGRCLGLLDRSAGFARMIRNRRLAAEVAVIHALASSLARRLLVRDPLADRVHHGKFGSFGIALIAAAGHALRQRR
jgi:squalene synthase HpnC